MNDMLQFSQQLKTKERIPSMFFFFVNVDFFTLLIRVHNSVKLEP